MGFQSDSQGFSDGWSVSHSFGRGWGVTHSSTQSWAVAEGVSCGVHTCTAKCARVHLALEVQDFRKRLEHLAKTVPARDYAWFRWAILDAFEQVLEGHGSDIDKEEK